MRTNPCNKNLTNEMQKNGYYFVPTHDEQIVFQSKMGGTAGFGTSQDVRDFLDHTYEVRREIEDETIGAQRRALRAPRIDFYASNQDAPPVWAIEPEMIMNPNEEGYEKFAEGCREMTERMNALERSGNADMRLVSVVGSEAFLDFDEDKTSLNEIKQIVSHKAQKRALNQRKMEKSR